MKHICSITIYYKFTMIPKGLIRFYTALKPLIHNLSDMGSEFF